MSARKSSPPTSSPPRPRTLRAADRCVAGSKSPGPGPLLPTAPLQELCPSTWAILPRLSAIPDAPFGGGPHPLTSGSPASNDSRTAPRRSTSGHYPWPTVTPRFDRRAERRHPCAPRQSTNLAATTWLCLPARNWLCFSARYQFLIIFKILDVESFDTEHNLSLKVRKQAIEDFNFKSMQSRLQGSLNAKLVKKGMTTKQVINILGSDRSTMGSITASGSLFVYHYWSQGVVVTFFSDKEGVLRVTEVSSSLFGW